MSNSKNNEKEAYYFPVYCYRHAPSIIDGVQEIVLSLSSCRSRHAKKDSLKNRKIKVYSNYEDARQAGEDSLCDDDTYGVFKLELSNWPPETRLVEVINGGKDEDSKWAINLCLTKKDLKVIK